MALRRDHQLPQLIVRFPEERLTVIVLTNRDDPQPYKTALAIADLYL